MAAFFIFQSDWRVNPSLLWKDKFYLFEMADMDIVVCVDKLQSPKTIGAGDFSGNGSAKNLILFPNIKIQEFGKIEFVQFL